jgi:hypothetical protein
LFGGVTLCRQGINLRHKLLNAMVDLCPRVRGCLKQCRQGFNEIGALVCHARSVSPNLFNEVLIA